MWTSIFRIPKRWYSPRVLVAFSDNADYLHENHSVFLFLLFWKMFAILGPHPWHLEIPRPGVPWVLTTAMWVLSHDCTLHHSSWPHWILNPLSEDRDWTLILMDLRLINHWAMKGTPVKIILYFLRHFIMFKVFSLRCFRNVLKIPMRQSLLYLVFTLSKRNSGSLRDLLKINS